MGSTRSRSDGIGTVGIAEVEGEGVAVVDGVGRGRGTQGEVLTLREDGRGPRLTPIHDLQRGCTTGSCRCSLTRRCRWRGWSAKQGRDGPGRTAGVHHR